MRRTRRFLLLLITAILVVVGVIYSVQRETQARNAPSPPPALPRDVSARANEWTFDKTDGSRPIVRIFAKNFRQVAEGTRFELEGVRLHLYHRDGKVYDEVKSARADYDVNAGKLFSDGKVEIKMGVNSGTGKAAGSLVRIETSGVSFDSSNGSASTDRPAHFEFRRGEGSCTGARYDPSRRELEMHQEIKLAWWGEAPDQGRMEVESGSLLYNEDQSQATLTPWAKFKRGTLSVQGSDTIVTLADGSLKQIDSNQATGVDHQPNRDVEFGADHLLIDFASTGAIEKLAATDHARLESTSASGSTNVRSRRVDLSFEPNQSESILTKVLASGNSMVEAKPPLKAPKPSDTRIMKSEIIALYMAPGGEEIERMETETPGTVEFIPNVPGQRRRLVSGDQLKAKYAAANQIRTFEVENASTRTDSYEVKGKPLRPPLFTWSDHLLADFNPQTGALDRMEQWENFRYEEGDRRARAQKATLDSTKNNILLTGAARFWDASGSTAANTISMDQGSGDVEADGNVNSTRLPEKGVKQEGLLSGDQPIHAKSAHMTSTSGNKLLQYDGEALLWQGANRLQADRININREVSDLQASGAVVSQLLDSQESKGTGDKAKPQVFTVVRSPRLQYSDKLRIAHYTGGATLERASTVVTATEIRAFLKSDDQGSTLDKAFADGNVKIVQTAQNRTKVGVSEHSEYYPADSRVILEGGQPKLTDSVKGETRGARLTFYAENDKLLVEGGEQQKPVRSKLIRK